MAISDKVKFDEIHAKLSKATANGIDMVEEQVHEIGKEHPHLLDAAKEAKEKALHALHEAAMWTNRALARVQTEREKMRELF